MKIHRLTNRLLGFMLCIAMLLSIGAVFELFPQTVVHAAVPIAEEWTSKTQLDFTSMPQTAPRGEGWEWYPNANGTYDANTLVLNGSRLEFTDSIDNNVNTGNEIAQPSIYYNKNNLFTLVIADGTVNKIRIKQGDMGERMYSSLFYILKGLDIKGSGSLEIEYEAVNYDGSVGRTIRVFDFYSLEIYGLIILVKFR